MTKSVRWLVLSAAAVACTLVGTDGAFGEILPWRRHHNACCQTPAPTPCCNTAVATTGGCGGCGATASCNPCCPAPAQHAHHLFGRRHQGTNPCCSPCSYASAAPSCC